MSGSFIGTITALSIFLLETNREKNKRIIEKKENYKNALIYFKLLLESIVNVIDKQIEAYHEHAVKIKQNPLSFNLIRYFVSNDIDRLLNKFDQERLLQAYIQEFGNDIEVIKEFQGIFSILNYFDSVMKQVIKSQEVYLNELHNNLIKYKEISEDTVLKNCINVIEDIRQNNPNFKEDPLYISFNGIIINYYENASNPPTVEYIQEKLIKTLTNIIITDFRNIPQATAIAEDCRRATWLYNDIIFKSNNISNEFIAHYDGMITTMTKLKKFNKIFDLEVY